MQDKKHNYFFVQSIDDIKYLKKNPKYFSSYQIMVTKAEPYYFLQKSAYKSFFFPHYMIDFSEIECDDTINILINDFYNVFRSDPLLKDDIKSISIEIIHFISEAIHVTLSLRNFIKKEIPKNIVAISRGYNICNELSEENSIFLSILIYLSEKYEVSINIINLPPQSILKGYKTIQLKHKIFIWLGPLFRILLRCFKKYSTRGKVFLAVLFGYDSKRHRDIIERIRLSLNNYNFISISINQKLIKIFLNIFTFSKPDKKILIKGKHYIINKTWYTLFSYGKNMKLWPEIFFNKYLDYQWNWIFHTLWDYIYYFNNTSNLLIKYFNPSYFMTTTPFRKYLYISRRLKKNNIPFILLSHSGWINKPYIYSYLPDYYLVWGKAQKDFLMNQNIKEEFISVVGKPNFKNNDNIVTTYNKSKIKDEFNFKNTKKIITLFTYPFNSSGGVFPLQAKINLIQYYMSINKLLSINYDSIESILVIKSHPQFDLNLIYGDFEDHSIYDCPNADISKITFISDLIISIGPPSTILFEIYEYSKPILYIDCGLSGFILEQVSKISKVIKSDSIFKDEICKILNDNSLYNKLIEKYKNGMNYFISDCKINLEDVLKIK